ncbi:Integrase, catalytic core protein [Phytophthora megakarya]|uniref:Integrase, catalytic core protein n=1 Tax=Phytophthora megakarya TaxID=4795 RepID=A0A225V993_9STRA|nr:Integrase, catalytic core protein [Phytophthora megakarya]
MTTSQKKAEVVLGSDNYFHWEFAMRMTLARKGLLAHVQVVKDPATMTEAWLLNDMKALGLIAQGKKAEVVLGSDNYFHWEFTMRMTLEGKVLLAHVQVVKDPEAMTVAWLLNDMKALGLTAQGVSVEHHTKIRSARKGLLAHVQVVKDPATMTEAWLLNDMKALGLIAQGVSVEHHTKIRSATSAMQAWNTLLEFYNRTTMHNRMAMTRRLHEFKMEGESTMAGHLDKFDELIVGLQTLGEPLDDSRQLVILLSSLPAEYELIVSIVENSKDVTLIEAKEKLLKEYERQEKKETSERALKATSFGGKGKNGKFGKVGKRYDHKGNGSRRLGEFTGKYFSCGQVGHMKREYPEKANGGSHEDSVFAVGEDRSAGWLVDSGATARMTPHRNDLYEYSAMSAGMNVTIVDGKKIRVTGTGSVRLNGIDGKSIRMVEVLHTPGLDRRLLSVGKLADRGMSVEFQRNSCVIWNEYKAIASGKKYGKAYVLDCHQDTAYYTECAGVDSEWELWHAHMGHLNEDSLEKTQQGANGMPKTRPTVKTLCGGCMKGKQMVTHFPSRSRTTTSRPLELVHTDVMGPMKTKSKGGARYVLVFVDDYSRYVSEAANTYKLFLTIYEIQWGERIKCLRSDNGTEFVNKSMDKICQQYGIVHQKTVPYSPQQNGVAERMNRTIMEKARSMLHYKGVSAMWWVEAVNRTVYLINRSTNSMRSTTTPYELSF